MMASTQRTEFIYKLSEEDTAKLIKLRASNDALFTGRRNAARLGWRAILKEMGLEKKLSSDQAAKKWDNLKNKYKEMIYVPPETASCWQWFHLMNEAMEGRLAGSASALSTSLLGDDDEFVPTPSKKPRRMPERSDILEFLTKMEDGRGNEVTEGDRVVMYSEGSECEAAMTDDAGGAMKDESMEMLSAGLEMERMNLRRDRQLLDREQAEVDRERVMLERERGLVERERAAIERDRAQLEKDRAVVDRDRASLEQDRAILEKDRASLEREKAAVVREREALKNDLILEKNNSTNSELDIPETLERKDKFIYLFEKLIEKL